MITLNQGQQAAADGFFAFLFRPETELIITGPGGVGKTALMGYLIDEIMPRYHESCKIMGIAPEYHQVAMTATTNKAAEVLSLAAGRPTTTIHSLLNLKVQDDYATGRSRLTRTNNWRVHENMIIFVDEGFTVDSQLLQMIRDGTHKSKIVYVGDHCQLAPVGESKSPVERIGCPYYVLQEPVRNAGEPDLIRACAQFRETVETGVFKPIQVIPGVIDHLDDLSMEQEIDNHFAYQNPNARILAYTNQRVIDYNDHIRGIRQLPPEYQKGELLVNNGALRLGASMLSVEEEVEILETGASTHHEEWTELDGQTIKLEVRECTLQSKLGKVYQRVLLPVDRTHFSALVKYYGQRKMWTRYFFLKNRFPDLRPRDAATVHKAQGSTYETVFIDLGNLSTCHMPSTVARLLYVAFTRARSRVILYGELAPKYGGIIHHGLAHDHA